MDKSLPWNYQVVFNLPPQTYYTTYILTPHDPGAEIEKKLNSMPEYKDALDVINKIKQSNG